MTTEPKGVVMLLINSEGSVVANVADFDTLGYGGFTLIDSQKRRVRSKLAYTFLKDYAGEDIASAIEDHDARKIIDNLCLGRGYKQRFIPIGYGEDVDINY